MQNDRVTFWLYYGSQIVASVRADRWASMGSIRAAALEMHDTVPCIGLDQNEAPFERRAKIACAEIRI